MHRQAHSSLVPARASRSAASVASLASLASLLLVAGCDKDKQTTAEEAPIRVGSTPDQQRPKPPAPPVPVDPHAGMHGTPAAPTPPPPVAPPVPPVVDPNVPPGGTVSRQLPGDAPVTPPTPVDLPMDTVRAPVAADLAAYLKKVKGKGTLTATIATTMGTFHCELYEQRTPMTVANFVGLATGQKPWAAPDGKVQKNKPFFDGLGFHRVIPDFMIQGGDPLGSGTGGPGYNFDNEIDRSLHHDGAGILSMANAGPGTNGSQFFVTEKATPWLDGKHTIFGKCKEGDLVKSMTAISGPGDKPTKPITMTKVTISRG